MSPEQLGQGNEKGFQTETRTEYGLTRVRMFDQNAELKHSYLKDLLGARFVDNIDVPGLPQNSEVPSTLEIPAEPTKT